MEKVNDGKMELGELLSDNEHDKDEIEIIKIVDENVTVINMSKLGVIKNLLVISISFMLLFSAYNSFANLQSSLNKEDGLGTTGLCTVFVVIVLSSLLLAPLTMSKFSPKWIMVVSMFMNLIYIATGFYSSWYTVVPASVIIGIGASHLWLAMQSYVTDIAKHYATLTDTKHQDRLTLFLGIFYAFTYTCNIWGNLLSSFIFRGVEDNTTIDVDELICGPHFCPYLELNTSQIIMEPSKQQVYTYTGVCVGLGFLGMTLIALAVTNISTESSSKDVCRLIQQVARLLCTSRSQHLLFFPTLLGGLTHGFLTSDFTQAYISCPYGIKDVGFVMVVYGICQATSSIVFGKLNQYTGHLAIYFFGFIAQLGLHITMLLWTPIPSEQYTVYVLAAMFGIAGAINVPMISALYNKYFTKDRAAAISSFRMINAAGGAIAMGYSNWLCTRYKLCILLTVLTLSMLSLIIQHIRYRRKCKRQSD